jgi:hypothetical protein
VLVALGIQHAKRVRRIAISGLHCSAIVFHLVLFGTIKKKVTEHKSLF